MGKLLVQGSSVETETKNKRSKDVYDMGVLSKTEIKTKKEALNTNFAPFLLFGVL